MTSTPRIAGPITPGAVVSGGEGDAVAVDIIGNPRQPPWAKSRAGRWSAGAAREAGGWAGGWAGG